MAIFATPFEQWEELKKGVFEILPEEEFREKLEASYREQKPLIVKFGADPSRSDLHLGHMVVLDKLKVLQDFGHQVYFLIGNFTARLGDPTGKSKTRVQLTQEEVDRYGKTYQEQIFRVLDPEKTRIVYNASWLSQLSLESFFGLLSSTTVGQLLAREDFSKRWEEKSPLFMHEFLYPLLQGYDSVVLQSDLELGGSDQKLNLLMGRHLQKSFGKKSQSILMMPLLEGLDGVQKMSKSMGNTVDLTDSADVMFGKIMSISDPLMVRYYELVSQISASSFSELKRRLEARTLHPMEAKKNLALEIVERYHGMGSGRKAQERFESLFSKKSGEVDLPLLEVVLPANGRIHWVSLLVERQIVESKSQVRRLLQQKAIRLDGEALVEEWYEAKPRSQHVLKVGKLKRFSLQIQSSSS
jgi:tyrosyl-tRNA synthetase